MIKNKRIFPLLIVAVLLIGCSPQGVQEKTEDNIRKFDTTNDVKDTAYINETTYVGTSLPAELYEISFRTSEDGQYVSNKELTEYIGGDEKILPYLNTANEALILTFAQNGLAIKEDDYKEKIVQLYKSTSHLQVGEEMMTTNDYALHLYGLYVDNRISVRGDFESDSSLFWQSDYMYYVRGILTLTLEEDANNVYEEVFGIPLNKQNKTLDLIVQVRFMPGNPNEILGVEILGSI